MMYEKVLPVRMGTEQYQLLRKLAYLEESSMSEIVRNIIEEKINSQRKVLTNADIAI